MVSPPATECGGSQNVFLQLIIPDTAFGDKVHQRPRRQRISRERKRPARLASPRASATGGLLARALHVRPREFSGDFHRLPQEDTG